MAQPWTLDVKCRADGLLVGTIGQVCVAIWRTKPTLQLFRQQRRELGLAVASDPGNVAFLCVVEHSADPPDQDVRDASVAMIASHAAELVACACVIEGSGFRAAITRTVLTGMALVARNTAPTRFFERVPLASDWLCQRLGRQRGPGLPEAVELARKHLA